VAQVLVDDCPGVFKPSSTDSGAAACGTSKRTRRRALFEVLRLRMIRFRDWALNERHSRSLVDIAASRAGARASTSAGFSSTHLLSSRSSSGIGARTGHGKFKPKRLRFLTRALCGPTVVIDCGVPADASICPELPSTKDLEQKGHVGASIDEADVYGASKKHGVESVIYGAGSAPNSISASTSIADEAPAPAPVQPLPPTG